MCPNTGKNVNILMERKNGRMQARHVTAPSHLVREVNYFLLAYVILFKRVNFRQYLCVFAKKNINSLISATY